ncbi:unnamed protein product [Phytophthora fragariaefolia]|uniref:Unnamed protein product n=1 Tax=Phytophthora fragariaefolia TaxID=1490495 RepID=A0A9W7CTJ0_9STRA|nr:unnamed protein product [Phytophthora fragariaefolia]
MASDALITCAAIYGDHAKACQSFLGSSVRTADSGLKATATISPATRDPPVAVQSRSIEETSHLDQLLQEDDKDDEEVEDGSINIQESGSNEEAVGQTLLELADFEWSEIDLDTPAMFNPMKMVLSQILITNPMKNELKTRRIVWALVVVSTTVASVYAR